MNRCWYYKWRRPDWWVYVCVML